MWSLVRKSLSFRNGFSVFQNLLLLTKPLLVTLRKKSFFVLLLPFYSLDSQKKKSRSAPCADLTGQRLAKFCRTSDFLGKYFPEGSESLAKQKVLAKKLAQLNIRLIACEHHHTHLNKLRCIVDHVLQTVI